MKCQNLWDTFLEIGSLSYPRVADLLLHKKEAARKEGKNVSALLVQAQYARALCAGHAPTATALKKANKGQSFFAQAQYFFSLDSRSAEMQGAVAALLAGIVTAVVAAARAA